MRILLLEDEPELAGLIAQSLTENGFAVDVFPSLAEGKLATREVSYGLVLLDRRLADGDGIGLLAELRARSKSVPVLILSALDGLRDRVIGLDAGADDYLVKPVQFEELHARVRAALRRRIAQEEPVIRCGRLEFDPVHREASVAGQPIQLRRRERAILAELMQRVGRVVQRDRLIEQVYSFDDDVQPNTLDAHVSRLRAKLGGFSADATIHAVRGIGYMIAPR